MKKKKAAAKPKASKKRRSAWHPFKNKRAFLEAEALASGRLIAQQIAEENPGVPVYLTVYL